MGWSSIIFLPFMVTMMILAASTAFYHQASRSHDDDTVFGRERMYHAFHNGSNGLYGYLGKTPLEIAQERYARGEMSHEEFDLMIKRLRESRHNGQQW